MANKKKTRPNILIDEDCYLSIKNLNKEDFYDLFMAVLEFGFERKEPKNLSGALEATYLLITKKMLRAQNRYDTCVKNGSKGGAPSGNQNAKKESETKTTRIQPEFNQSNNQNSTKIQPKNNQKDNQKTTKTITKPSIETEIESESETEIPNDKINKNIFSLPSCQGERANEHPMSERLPFLTEDYEYHKNDEFGNSILEIIDTLLDAEQYAKENGSIKYKSKTYSYADFKQILQNYGQELIKTITYKITKDTEIKNKPTYILGCLISLIEQRKIKKQR